MERKLTISNLKKVSAGEKIVVKGMVAQGAKRFAVNLGRDEANFEIHFNPRYDEGSGVIVCSSKIDEQWGPEKRYPLGHLKREGAIEIHFKFEGKIVTIYCPDKITFVSELNLDNIAYFSTDGDFRVDTVAIE